MRSLQPSRVIQAILAAQAAGRTAAEAALRELRLRHGEREQYDASAGAVMHLLLRRTSTLARDLEDLSRSLNWLFSVIPSGGSGEVILVIHAMSGRQEQCVNVAAEEAALSVLRTRLGVEGYVSSAES